MADLSTHIDIMYVNEAAKEVVFNGMFDAASQSCTYGRRESLCSGRTFAYFGGLVTLPDSTTIVVSNGTIDATASSTSYMVASKITGAVSASTSTTNWNSGDYWKLYSIVASTDSISNYTDYRQPSQYLGSNIYNYPITKTTSFTLGVNENEIICNGSGIITITLPSAASQIGRKIGIKNIAAFPVVSSSSNVVPIGSSLVATSILPNIVGSWATLISNGTNWVIQSIGNTTSGTYTPGLTGVTNYSTGGATDWRYVRVGDIVTVSGEAVITPTAAGLVEFRASLLIPSGLTNDYDLSGVFNAIGLSGRIQADTTNDAALFKFIAAGTTTEVFGLTFTYIVK